MKFHHCIPCHCPVVNNRFACMERRDGARLDTEYYCKQLHWERNRDDPTTLPPTSGVGSTERNMRRRSDDRRFTWGSMFWCTVVIIIMVALATWIVGHFRQEKENGDHGDDIYLERPSDSRQQPERGTEV